MTICLEKVKIDLKNERRGAGKPAERSLELRPLNLIRVMPAEEAFHFFGQRRARAVGALALSKEASAPSGGYPGGAFHFSLCAQSKYITEREDRVMSQNNSQNRNSSRVANLVLAGVLIALGTVLSFIKVFNLPYGGSITLCSMLPVMVFAYRCGPRWGLGAGFAYSVLQLLFGLDALKGISGATIVGSVLLDYLLAFTVLGLAGALRGRLKSDPAAFTLGCLISGLLRYLCSFLSGWILWSEFADVNFSPMLAGMDGQTLAFFYSLLYNGSYMIPEIILTCVMGFLVMQFTGKYILKPEG